MLAGAMFVVSSLQATQSREELLHSPKYADAKSPHFESFTPESLRDAVRVGSRRSYATSGFNDPAVTVRLPAARRRTSRMRSAISP